MRWTPRCRRCRVRARGWGAAGKGRAARGQPLFGPQPALTCSTLGAGRRRGSVERRAWQLPQPPPLPPPAAHLPTPHCRRRRRRPCARRQKGDHRGHRDARVRDADGAGPAGCAGGPMRRPLGDARLRRAAAPLARPPPPTSPVPALPCPCVPATAPNPPLVLLAPPTPERGYEVHVMVDGVSSQRLTDRSVALQRLAQAGAWLATSEMAMFQLMVSTAHPGGLKGGCGGALFFCPRVWNPQRPWQGCGAQPCRGGSCMRLTRPVCAPAAPSHPPQASRRCRRCARRSGRSSCPRTREAAARRAAAAGAGTPGVAHMRC